MTTLVMLLLPFISILVMPKKTSRWKGKKHPAAQCLKSQVYMQNYVWMGLSAGSCNFRHKNFLLKQISVWKTYYSKEVREVTLVLLPLITPTKQVYGHKQLVNAPSLS